MSIVAPMDMFRLLDMSMPDFLDTVREVTEVVSRRKRV